MISRDGRELCFIVGHYKSGSTWLANLLSLHPAVRGLKETHVFRYATIEMPNFDERARHFLRSSPWIGGGRRRLLRHRLAKWSRPVRRILGLAKGQSTLAPGERPTTMLDLTILDQLRLQRHLSASTSSDDFCRRFFDFLLARLRPGQYLLEKTPTNIHYAPLIRETFPAAKLVAIYRDGRDVVVSDKYYSALELHRNVQLKDSTLKWRAAMESQLKYASDFSIHCLTYESLLDQPFPVVQRLLEFLDLPAGHAEIEDMIQRSSFEFVTGRQRGTAANTFYRKGVAKDWVNHFTDVDMQQFSELAGDLLVELGYETSTDPATWKHACPVAQS